MFSGTEQTKMCNNLVDRCDNEHGLQILCSLLKVATRKSRMCSIKEGY